MENKKLKEEIRKEVIDELMPIYQSALQDLDIQKRIIAEKEKIFDLFFKYCINTIAIDNAKCKAEEDL